MNLSKSLTQHFALNIRVPAVVFAFSLFLYVSSDRSLFFNFDGVACAIAVELSDFKHLVHGNHLAYGVLAWTFDRAWRLMGYGGQALYSLQILNSLLGAAGAGVFSSLLLRAGHSMREALFGGAALALSHAWWFWSLEAQVYMLGAVFAALAAHEALDEKPRPWLVGLWHGAAVLGHIGNVMAAPALIWALTRGGGRKTLIEYCRASAIVIVATYAAAAVLAVRPASFEEWRLWLLGSAALNSDRGFAWHGMPPAQSVAGWTRLCLDIFWASPSYPALLALAAAAIGLRRGGKTVRFWGLWLAGYAVLYLTWEPNTIVYRVTDILAFSALALEGLRALGPRRRAVVLALWCAATGFHNWTHAVRPASRLEGNAAYLEAIWTARSIPENAWILAVGNGQVYLPYFARRKPLNPRYWRDEAGLFARLDALAAADEPAYATDRSMAASGWSDSFHRYGLEEVAHANGLILYQIRGQPIGKSRKKLTAAPTARKGPKGMGSERRAWPVHSNPKP